MDDRLSKPYDPKETEGRIYKRWEESGYFNPDNLPERHQTPFCTIMPPPNANGHLHAGHGLDMTLKDILVRYKRMRGYKTLWVPGADHAGFETQIVFERKLDKEGRSRFKMEPKELYDEIMAFTLENKQYMEEEVKRLGASCDWSREKFTLDKDVIREVHRTFEKMHQDGLVYRGKRPVNWCPKHQTSLSDVETMAVEQNDPLYYMKYGPFTLATVRPETKFGDTAIAVNPKDDRYRQYVGQEIEIDTLIGKATLKVIADDFVDMEFGTGAVKVTPAHDPNDFEMSQRHNLPLVEVIDRFGRLNERAGKYAGLKVAEARQIITADLEKAGLLEKIDASYKHVIKTCYKCGNTIEPRIMDQWFVKMQPLAELAIKAVEQDKLIPFNPDNFRKIFLYWMKNTTDWNISRQIVWGIPIPAKICDDCGLGYPDLNDELRTCPKCGKVVRRDTDTFDTWFSSGQWPYLALGFPHSPDYATYYPTDIMETGSDLIFKWIPRMVFFSLYVTGQIPFKEVYLHGMVNDAVGKKMSKSKGNVINPLEMGDKYGIDALRMALVVGNTPGQAMSLAENKIKGYKHFANKLWNMARFIMTNSAESDAPLTPPDQTLLQEFVALSAEVSEDMEKMRFHLAAEKLYHYAWRTLADKIIEESKPILQNQDEATKLSRASLLRKLFTGVITLLHPFMPFVTEELWSMFNPEAKLLMIAKWPQ